MPYSLCQMASTASSIHQLESQLTVEKIRAGFSFGVFKHLRDALGLTDAELAQHLLIPIRTFRRRTQTKSFDREQSDRLARIATVYVNAAKIFGPIPAREWMKTPLPALGGNTPLGLCDTSLGASEVEDLIGRIDYGVYS
jgi:putative toxin-antitoxin system antitoxin component (TIGR02293 family)